MLTYWINLVTNKHHGVQIAILINEKDADLKFQKDDIGDTALSILYSKDGDVKKVYDDDGYFRWNMPQLAMRQLLENLELDPYLRQTSPMTNMNPCNFKKWLIN